MPFCKKCGAMLHDGASFCMACGAKYEEPRGRYYEEPDTSDEEENLNSAPVTQVNNEQPHIVGITEPETKLVDNTPNMIVQNDAVQQEPQITEPVQPSIENKEPAQPSYYEPPIVQQSIENKEPAQPSYYEPPTAQPSIENKEPAQPSYYEPPTAQPSIENKEPAQPSYYEPPTVQQSIENKEPAQPSYYESPTVQQSIENKEPAQPSYYESPTAQPSIENKEPAQPSYYEPPTVQQSIENKEPAQPSYYEPPTAQPSIENKESAQPSYYEPPTVQPSIENKESAQPSYYEPPTVQPSIENKEPAQPSYYEPPTVQPSYYQPNNDQSQTAQQQEHSRPKFLDDQSIDTKQPVQYKNPFAISDQQNTTAKEVPKWMLNQHPSLPIKNHSHSGKKIAIFAACLIILLGGCAVVAKMFFARDLLQMCMGQANYMKSIEQGTVTSLTDTTVDDLNMVLQLIPTSGGDRAFDYEAACKINFDDAFRKKYGGDTETVNKFIDFLNELKYKGSYNINNNQAQMDFYLTHKSNNLISVNMFGDKSGKSIIQVPEISKKYLVTKSNSNIESISSSNPFQSLKFDPDKLKTSLHSIMQPYVDAVSSAKVTVLNDQTVLVGGVTVKAQKISATFTDEQVDQIAKKMLEIAKNDEYFYTFVSDNCNMFGVSTKGGKPSKAQYQSMVDSAIAEVLDTKNEKPSDSFTVSAYVDRDNSQVARTYEIQSAEGKSSFSFINSNQYGKKQVAFSLMVDNKSMLSATIVYSNSDSGTVQILLADNNSTSGGTSLSLEFSGVKKGKFMGHDILLGTYKLSLSQLENVAGNDLVKQYSDSANWSKANISLTYALNNNKMDITMQMEIPKSFSATMNFSITPKTSSPIKFPEINDSNSIDETKNSAKMEQYSKDALKYLTTLRDKDKDLAGLLDMIGINQKTLNQFSNNNFKL